jgi:hypothetical protein
MSAIIKMLHALFVTAVPPQIEKPASVRIVETVPLRLETSVVDFVNSEKRQRYAHGMQRTGFGNLEHRLR